MFESVVNSFNDNLDTTARSIEDLVSPIVAASQTIVTAFLQEKKVLACASGQSSFIANHFVTTMLNRFEHERPSLPAVSLCSDGGSIKTIANEAGLSEVYAKPIMALGQPGDVLFVAADSERNKSLIQAIQAAHDRNMDVIAMTAGDGGDIPALLLAEDIELRATTLSRARTLEVQLLISHCICDLIDKQLFGG